MLLQGLLPEKKIFEVHIDKGHKHNAKVVLRGEAGYSEPGILPGDVIFVLEQKPHKTFKRIQADLVIEKVTCICFRFRSLFFNQGKKLAALACVTVLTCSVHQGCIFFCRSMSCALVCASEQCGIHSCVAPYTKVVHWMLLNSLSQDFNKDHFEEFVMIVPHCTAVHCSPKSTLTL